MIVIIAYNNLYRLNGGNEKRIHLSGVVSGGCNTGSFGSNSS